MRILYFFTILFLLSASCGVNPKENKGLRIPDETANLNRRIAQTNESEIKNLQYLLTTFQYRKEFPMVSDDLIKLYEFDERIQELVTNPIVDSLKSLYDEIRKYEQEIRTDYSSSGYPQHRLRFSRSPESPNNLMYEVLELERKLILFLSNQMFALLTQKLDQEVFLYVDSNTTGVNNDSIKHSLVIIRDIGREPRIVETNGSPFTQQQTWEKNSFSSIVGKKGELTSIKVAIPAMSFKEGETLIEVNLR